MLRQLTDALRHTESRDISRGSEHGFFKVWSQWFGDHTFFDLVTETNSQIHTLFENIDRSIKDRDFQLYFRKALAKLRVYWLKQVLIDESGNGN